MKPIVAKRSIVIAGHKTSVSLEDAFWRGLKELAFVQDMTLSSLVAKIDTGRKAGNLSSAIRLFVLESLRSQASQIAPQANSVDRLVTGKDLSGAAC